MNINCVTTHTFVCCRLDLRKELKRLKRIVFLLSSREGDRERGNFIMIDVTRLNGSGVKVN